MNSPQRLHKFGQCVWFDFIRRNMFASGELKRPVTKDGILEFSRGDDVDAETIFESLEASGIQQAADTPRILWTSTGTENPACRDTLNMEESIGPDTVNTVSPNRSKTQSSCLSRPSTNSLARSKSL